MRNVCVLNLRGKTTEETYLSSCLKKTMMRFVVLNILTILTISYNISYGKKLTA